MNQSNNRPAEKYSLDLCKFIMAFAVIAIHTDPLVDCSNAAMSRIGYLLLSMAVPFFFHFRIFAGMQIAIPTFQSGQLFKNQTLYN